MRLAPFVLPEVKATPMDATPAGRRAIFAATACAVAAANPAHAESLTQQTLRELASRRPGVPGIGFRSPRR